MNEVILNKIASVQRCVMRAREEYVIAQDQFSHDFSHQDAATLNILRACEQTIDLANLTIKTLKMGIPKHSAESFELLAENHVIPQELALTLIKMVGFRNRAIHDYQSVDIPVLIHIIMHGLNDVVIFSDTIQNYWKNSALG